ncbi:bladder cancer associated transcript 1 isoform X1 [Molothrus aeneus]|uniref:bladder cancer associated transcript 1 isoform X1 n=1 Tax=Molothrus aeneus TaxID=84833 RepID=UPI00345B0608
MSAGERQIKGSERGIAAGSASPGAAAHSGLQLPVMPQFTFACFCGLHGFCKMKRKKEEAGGGQETAV